MRDELLRKVEAALSAKIKTEAELVYLLVEIRKLMDRENYKDPIVRCFCNWIVHVDLAIPNKGTTALLKEFDKTFDPSRKPDLSNPDELRNHLCPPHGSFGMFRKHLQGVLKHFNLPIDLTKKEKSWGQFGKLYASIVSDCPISIDPKRATPETTLKHIEKIELTAPDSQESPLTFLVWKVKVKGNPQMQSVTVIMD